MNVKLYRNTAPHAPRLKEAAQGARVSTVRLVRLAAWLVVGFVMAGVYMTAPQLTPPDQREAVECPPAVFCR